MIYYVDIRYLPNTLPSVTLKKRRYAGLLTLGVGDSAAAVIGTFYGRSKLPWPASSSRSFQGTVANIVSVIASVLLLSTLFNVSYTYFI